MKKGNASALPSFRIDETPSPSCESLTRLMKVFEPVGHGTVRERYDEIDSETARAVQDFFLSGKGRAVKLSFSGKSFKPIPGKDIAYYVERHDEGGLRYEQARQDEVLKLKTAYVVRGGMLIPVNLKK